MRAGPGLGQQLARDRLGARPFARRLMRPCRREGATMSSLDVRHRREPQRVLAQLRRECSGAALRRQPRRVVEREGDVRVGCIAGQREVPCTGERVVDEFCQPPVDARVVDGRGKQRVGEADRPALACDHTCIDCGLERLRRDPARRSRGSGAVPSAAASASAGASRGEPGHPPVHELVQSLRHRQRLRRIHLCTEGAGDLERVERIAARLLVNAQQRLAGEDATHAIVQERVERADAERAQRQPPEARLRQGPLDLGEVRAVDTAPRQQQQHGALVEPT